MVTGEPFASTSWAGDGTTSAAAAGGGTVIFSMIIIQTDPAVQLKITGDLQRIEGVDCEGIRLTIGVCAVQSGRRDECCCQDDKYLPRVTSPD